MKNVLILLGLSFAGLMISAHASEKSEYKAATVVRVDKHETPSNYVGDSPTDAPLQADMHSYDIGIRLDCTVYTVRYESALDYLPSAFTPNRAIEINLRKHVVGVLIGGRDLELGIVYHSQAKDSSCLSGK